MSDIRPDNIWPVPSRIRWKGQEGEAWGVGYYPGEKYVVMVNLDDGTSYHEVPPDELELVL